MANPWDADVELSREDAARLVDGQFRELAPASLTSLGRGWDNDAYVVNGAFVFRFPRRRMAAELLACETRVLPQVSGRVPLPVPDPRYLGSPEGGYPYPFAGYALLPGETADRVLLDDDARTSLAPVLAGFLRALHDVPVTKEVPGDVIRRTDLAFRVKLLAEKLARVEGDPAPGVAADEVIEKARALSRTPPHAGEPRLVHGDLYARHLLLDDERRLCGVIDWGDVHAGDPALDLSIAYAFVPPAGREAFFDRYGDTDESTHARARFRALWYGACLVEYGRSGDDHAIAKAGETALRLGLL